MRKESVFSLKSTSNSDLMNTKEIVSRDSISKFDKTVINVETELEDKPYLEPWAWISLSIICSIIYAISNVVKSEISQYGFMARCLQAPGNLVTNFSTAVFISFYYKTSDEEKGLLHNEDKNINSSYFKWVYEIFYELPMSKSYLKSDDTENFNTNQPINNSSDKEVSKISWSKTCVFFGIVFVNMFSYWTFIESYKQAISIEMNVGILTSLLSLKPALIAFFFWLLFHQKLRWVDILGIFLLICSIVLMSLKLDIYDSESDLAKANSITTKVVISTMIQQNNRDEVVGRLSAISLMILTVVLLMLGNLGFKYLSKEANIVSVNNLSNLIVSIPFFIVLV